MSYIFRCSSLPLISYETSHHCYLACIAFFARQFRTFKGCTLFNLTYLLTPWSRVLLDKLTGSQQVTKFPAFYGTRRFITTFTSTRLLALSWVSSIPSMPHIPLPKDPSYNCPPIYDLVFQVVSFPQVSPKNLVLTCPPYVLHASPISFFSIWSPEQYLVKSTDHWATRYVAFLTALLPPPS
jgi:hypothetical protein